MSMTIAEKLVQDAENWQGVATTKASLFNAIAAKGVPVPADAKLADTPSLVDAIQTGGTSGTLLTHKVDFVDFDGAIINTQIVEHGKAAIAPVYPEIEYTTALGWLDDFSNVTDDLVVFLSRQSSDGNTRAFITLNSELTGLTVWINISVYINGTIIIDYGDGYVLTLPSGTAANLTTIPGHTYAASGDYVITISGTAKIYPEDLISGADYTTTKGALIGTKYSANSTGEYALTKLFVGNNIYQIRSLAYHKMLTAILLPTVAPHYSYMSYTNAFRYTSIKCLIFPSGVTSPSDSFIHYSERLLDSLRYVRFPDGYNGAYGYANSYNFSVSSNVNRIYVRILIGSMTYIPRLLLASADIKGLKNIEINATQIGNSAFDNTKGLESIKLNSSVRIIGNGAFRSIKNCIFDFEDIGQLTEIHSGAFLSSSLGGNIDLPVTCKAVIGAFGFTEITHLKIRNVIAGVYGSSNTLYNMPNLVYLDLEGTMNITNLVDYAPKLKGVIIRNPTPPTITSTAFRMSGLENVVLHVYVPDETWDYYIVATNWVTLYNTGKLHKISEYVD